MICATCTFWRDGFNECHRYPPPPRSDRPVIWPVTLAGDWCGEHRARTTITVTLPSAEPQEATMAKKSGKKKC